MKKIIPLFALAAIAALFSARPAVAQSGGNFVSTVNNTVCSINSTNGAFTNGPGNIIFTSSPGGSLVATIKLPSSSPGLLVTPSLVTGLYTNQSFLPGTSQTGAIVVVVTDQAGSATPVTLTPNQTCVDTTATGNLGSCTSPGGACKCGVAYDERFQNLSGFASLIQSTLTAHSFNFTEGIVPGGLHTITMNWYFGCDDGSGTLRTANCMSTFLPDTAAACAGPGTLTVQQVQNFQQDKQGIGTTGP